MKSYYFDPFNLTGSFCFQKKKSLGYQSNSGAFSEIN